MDLDGHQLKLSKGKVKSLGKEYSERISGDAAIVVAFSAERYIRKQWRLASELASHAGRQTVQEEDARLADEILRGEV